MRIEHTWELKGQNPSYKYKWVCLPHWDGHGSQGCALRECLERPRTAGVSEERRHLKVKNKTKTKTKNKKHKGKGLQKWLKLLSFPIVPYALQLTCFPQLHLPPQGFSGPFPISVAVYECQYCVELFVVLQLELSFWTGTCWTGVTSMSAAPCL